MNSWEQRLRSHRLIPVVTLPDIASAVSLGEILVSCGMEVAEITFRTSHAAQGIAEMKKRFPELLLLAGTILTSDQVDSALDAGAEAIVSPGTDPKVVTHCRDMNIPVFPGICTPSEVQTALSLGITELKFFPAELSGGVKMARTLLDVYNNISLMPTGGISPDNIEEYLNIDRVICCGASWLTPESLMAEGNWQEIKRRIKTAVTNLAQYS